LAKLLTSFDFGSEPNENIHRISPFIVMRGAYVRFSGRVIGVASRCGIVPPKPETPMMDITITIPGLLVLATIALLVAVARFKR
jgi:hypothetical protein